ncbi:NAD-dependent epimerase/dehydratase family protein [Halomicrobium katesii]|uniref:NAD-dependent epimerase/dehydratase family protein n=1 Tax=Halomicrobium katesii TaxID=437163 RepID=UPI0004765A43|nr:NAD-dependent epimerase/dehydratase family protein [Halomicrobium katesii]
MPLPDSVLVTGGAGFVGSHAVEYYADRDVDVTAIDNLSRAETLSDADEEQDTALHNWNYITETYPDVDLRELDIRDFDALCDVVAGHDAIVHTAGQVAVTASLEDPRTDFEVNAEGTFNILEAARLADTDPRVVVASTNKVYGDNVNEISVEEHETRYAYDDPEYDRGIPEAFSIDGCEHTPYGTSKLAADLYVQDYAARGVVDAAAFRMSCIYGPRQFGNEDQGWVAHFALSVLRDKPITIFGDGKQVRDLCHVTDLVRAYDAFISDPTADNGVYNIGGGVNNTTSLVEFLELLEEMSGKTANVTYDEWREGDQKVYISDISRAKDALDWEPAIDIETGIERFVEWYESANI